MSDAYQPALSGLAEDTTEILDRLGYGEQDIQRLATAGVAGIR
jgi:hypothetical protein